MRSLTLSLLLLLLACGRGEAPEIEIATVELDRDVVNLSEVGATTSVAARVLDAARRSVEGVSLRWWSSNPGVADVTADGVVTATGDGVARIWASAGEDSVFAVVVVEPARPEVRFAILPSVVRFDAVGDTTRLRLTPLEETPDSLLPSDSLEQFCQSADGAVAILAEGGVVASRGNGVTQVRCHVGPMSDSARVIVEQRAVRVAIIAQRDLEVLVADDSLPLTLARVDRRGAAIPDAQPAWRALDPDIAVVDEATGVVHGRSVGEGRVIGELHGLADTAVIAVRDEFAEPALAARPVIIPRRRRVGGPRLERPTGAATRGRGTGLYGARELARDEMLFQTPQYARALGTRRFTTSAELWQAEHRVDVGAGVDKTTGLMFGGGITYRPGRLYFAARALSGKLTSDSAGVADQEVTDAQLDIGIEALPWLDFVVGASGRAYRNLTLNRTQRWLSLRAGGKAHFDLMEGVLQALLIGEVLPAVSVDLVGAAASEVQSPSLGFVAGAGVEYRAGILVGGVYFRLERYDFPRVAGFDRREQFSALRVRIGLEFGGG